MKSDAEKIAELRHALEEAVANQPVFDDEELPGWMVLAEHVLEETAA